MHLKVLHRTIFRNERVKNIYERTGDGILKRQYYTEFVNTQFGTCTLYTLFFIEDTKGCPKTLFLINVLSLPISCSPSLLEGRCVKCKSKICMDIFTVDFCLFFRTSDLTRTYQLSQFFSPQVLL